MDHAIVLARLDEKPCVTRQLAIHGSHREARNKGSLAGYGSDASKIGELIRADAELAESLHPSLPINGAQVVWAVRHEMARTVDDVLARRTRALFLNARAAIAMAPGVARIMARELVRDEEWQRRQLEQFHQIAGCFLPES